MSDIFGIRVFPAQRGDALWIEYGPEAQPFRILVDGGITKTGREHLVDLVRALGNGARIDLLVVTHIDLDHILGVIALLQEFKATVEIKHVWFNGWEQLPRDPLQPFGIKEGIALSKLLKDHHAAAWNVDANGGSIGVAADGAPRKFQLPGGMVATVLSPDTQKLLALKEDWDEVVDKLFAWGYRAGMTYQSPDRTADRCPDVPWACAVVSGRLGLNIEGQSFELDMGDCLFLPKGKTYSAEVLGNDPVWLLEASKPS